jgi:hypothetical protein
MTELDPQEILGRYDVRGDFVTLTEAEQAAVRRHLGNNSMKAIYGSVHINEDRDHWMTDANGDVTAIGSLLRKDDGVKKHLEKEGNVLGPYFLGEDYVSDGVMVWAPEEAGQEPAA